MDAAFAGRISGMNRRELIQGAGAVATSTLVHGCRARADCTQPPGVQLYSIRENLQRDARGALATLGEIGLREAEMWGLNGPENAQLFGMPARDLKSLLDDNGIRVPISHIGGALSNVPEIAAIAHTLGCETLVVALPSEFSRVRDGRFAHVGAESVAQLDELARKLDATGRAYRAQGLGFGYHNHHIEFLEVEDTVPFEYLMANTDPELVKIELDIGWLAVAGVDPVEYLRRYQGRVIACHLKDYDPSIVTEVLARKLVEPGAGTIDFAAVLAAMDETGVAHGFVEIDVSDDRSAPSRGTRISKNCAPAANISA
jgi:sugar phosphate isomerase/epimerase